jgi:cytochrome P450
MGIGLPLAKGVIMGYEAPTVGDTEPVEDWLHDFDVFDPGYVRDPFPVWDAVRGCPVLSTERWGGVHLVIGYDAVVQAAANTTKLTSTLGTSAAPTLEDHRDPNRPQSIINNDPPEHTPIRRTILPTFAPQAVAGYEPTTRALCELLADKIAARLDNGVGFADAAFEYSQQIPARVIGRILGIPESRTDEFIEWVRAILETGIAEPEKRKQAFQDMGDYFAEEIAERRRQPRQDLITSLVNARLDNGEPVPDRNIVGNCVLLLVAGIDTTWSAIGSSIWHLAQYPGDVARLRAEPELWPTAIEEFLRAFAPVTMGRIATSDTEVAGCPVSEGRRVLLAFPAANRDPAVFDRPNDVILDRELNRHVAFGSGIHRCAGSNIARMELRVALQVWLERFPVFSLADAEAVTWAGGQVRGPRSVPVRIG